MIQQRSEWMQGYFASEDTAKDVIAVKRIYIDINDGNLFDGILFSQIMYWHGNSLETGKPRMDILRGGYLWLAKSYDEWEKECRIGAATARKCIDRMAERGLLVKQVYKFGGVPTVHIRIHWENLEKCIKSICYPVSNGNDTAGQMETPSGIKSYTETTAQTTDKELNTPPTPLKGGVDKSPSPPITGKVSVKRKKADAYCMSCQEGIEALVAAAHITVPAARLADKDLYLLIEVYDGTIRYSIPPDKFIGLVQFARNAKHWIADYTPTLRDINNNLLPYSTYLNTHQPPPPAAPMETTPPGFNDPDGTEATPEEMAQMQAVWDNLLNKTKVHSVMGDEVKR